MSALIGPVQSPDLHVMSFNVRRRMTHVVPRSPDLWSRRRPAVHKLLATEQPTILGVQEALPDQAQVIAASLGQHYKRIGRGRNAQQRGEGCPVFFDSRRLRLTGWRQLALSDTPEVPGSRSWGNFVPRLIVCASFADRSTGQEFRFLNTHFDHLSRKSRLRSADLVTELVRAGDTPVILTGDFNTSIHTSPYERLTTDGLLADSWFRAEKRLTEAWGTFPNYRAPKLDRKRIDWVLATRDIDVLAAATNTSRHEGIAASDHLPVSALLRLPTR